MDENKKPENGSLSKKHFAKFHERVHNKYMEMQKKLEKSRSVDSLPSLSDNSPFRYSRDSTNSDIREDEVFETKSDAHTSIITYSRVVEDVNKCDATLKDFEFVPVYESVVTPSIDAANHEYVNTDTNDFFEDNWNLSLESIYDACEAKNAHKDRELKPDIDLQTTHSPTKVSLRYRIGERLLAARERRKEKKKDKEQKDQIILSKLEHLESASKEIYTKNKNKVASVAVAVIDACEPENETADKAPEEKPKQLLHCRIRLGTEKRKTKIAKSVDNKATWQKLFNIGLYDKYLLEVTVWDRDTFVGRCSIDLKTLEEELTHRLRLDLEECPTKAQLFMLITISGTMNNLIIESENHHKLAEGLENFIQEVGLLHIDVCQATRLPDNSDKYCVVELVNDRRQTHTEYKTGEPQWMKQFTITVRDVTSILSITVFEEKKADNMVELGKVLIPLLLIKNDVQRWYDLKDSTLTTAAKGHPKILLKMTLEYNSVKAAFRVLSPKEQHLLYQSPGFDRRVFATNVSRAKVVVTWAIDVVKLLKGLFEWDNPIKNFFFMVAWVIFWWNFKQWMLPLFLLIPFLLYTQSETLAQICKIFSPIYTWINKFDSVSTLNDNMQDNLGADETSKKEKKEDSKTLLQRVRSLTESISTAQTDVGHFASFGESVKNLVNFSVPFLSMLAIKLILISTVVMFFIPVRYLLIGWAIWKYFRKLIRPNRIPNNEILDLLSRVPDDETLLYCQELTENDDGRKRNSTSSINVIAK